MRELNPLDFLLIQVDNALRTLKTPIKRLPNRQNPAQALPETTLNQSQKKHTAGLVRVNHSGEVCAQALYQGQAITAKLDNVRAQMEKAAEEEVDHLAWCEDRLQELNSQPSVLNPLWYSGSLFLGMLAGLVGDKWSLGFVAETERQVSAHLENHKARIVKEDQKTRAILDQMQTDEEQHAQTAVDAGGAELPLPIKKLMGFVSKLMTKTSYHI